MDDDRPVERCARRPPKASAALDSVAAIIPPVRRRKVSDARPDPRFDHSISKTNPNAAEHHYGFMQELAHADARSAEWRLRCIRRELKRRDHERRVDAGEDDEVSELTSSDDEEEDDVHGAGMSRQDRLDAKVRYGLIPEHVLRREGAQLKAEAMRRKSLAGDAAAKAKAAKVKRETIKKELADVAAGKKARPFFPKRAELKTREAESRFNDIVASTANFGRAAKDENTVARTAQAAVHAAMERKAIRQVRGSNR
jgi:hypothetical protein